MKHSKATEFILSMLMVATLLFGAAGCRTSPPAAMSMAQAAAGSSSGTVRINAGDVVQITFPGAPTLNTTQRVELNGNIRLPIVGDVSAAGKTPAQLQAELVKLYAEDLQVQEVLVLLASSSASVFVGGAVTRPGRIPMERPLTVLDAIMEAGGFDPKRANVKKISVIRQKDGKYSTHAVNLRPALNGENVPPFNLQPFDVVFVPEKLF